MLISNVCVSVSITDDRDVMFNVPSATAHPDGGDDRGRGMRECERCEQFRRRRMPERVQLRLEMLRGRRVDLDLKRSHRVKFDGRRVRDREDERPEEKGQRRDNNRVFVGERGRVSGWSSSDNDVSRSITPTHIVLF